MIFRPTDLDGVVLVEPEMIEDARGAFARTFSRQEFVARGLDPEISECSVSTNNGVGTLRGLHFQRAPHLEAKLVRCARGRIWDVAVDLRIASPTYLGWIGVELDSRRRTSVFLPKGVAHGFLTLEPDTEVLYQISTPYDPGAAAGVRWDDDAFGIRWPSEPAIMSERDAAFPDFDPARDSIQGR